ncbi:LysR family transcriptional regulator [Rhodoplanes sp. Z2-YC6860]|uniref:LysR family transcriptional regulator n=1 Tax=Rhodoplanes sp. Z2-YC6860 TaxID=674703 RepID=UPI00078DDEA1|nr:LysR family transcriptional regulator [Rhodoplanes sp. Z2-YC6860]AMN44073.1 LysR family transcriptional regulator [Rhodoplanes sp. Z2-YC6860]
MELRHLRHFVAVAEEGHITRAAERLGLQQPPLSQRIKAIEDELGVQLFRRRPRGVEMTEAGRVFLERARATLAHYDGAFEATRSAARGEQGRLCIGIQPTTLFHPFVPSVIRAFRTAYPQVSLTLDECLRTEQIERLRNLQLDVGFLRSKLDDQKDFLVFPLLNEPLVAALPSNHSLARAGRRTALLSLKDLADEQFIIYARQHGPAFYETTMAACLKAGFTPRLGQEAPRITSALSLVAVGLGVSLVPACMQNMTMNGVVYRRLQGAIQPKAGLLLGLRRGDGSPVVRNFVNLVRKTANTFT